MKRNRRRQSECKCSCADEEEDNYPKVPILRNPHINSMEEDVLYHIGLSTEQNLQEMFGDVQFICMGGTPRRIENFAFYIMAQINYRLPPGTILEDISGYADRYSMYKVGPVLCVSHGMGCPSMSILLHELIKLVVHAHCTNPVFIRMGTCGGIGVEGGTVVITEEVLDAQLRKAHEFVILGKPVLRPTKLDPSLTEELKALGANDSTYQTVVGKTLCTDDFYEGQARLDGAICDYTNADKIRWLQTMRDEGVVNIEMESSVFAALTSQAGIRAAIICVVILNRLEGDQVDIPKEKMFEWQERPQQIVGALIRKRLGI